MVDEHYMSKTPDWAVHPINPRELSEWLKGMEIAAFDLSIDHNHLGNVEASTRYEGARMAFREVLDKLEEMSKPKFTVPDGVFRFNPENTNSTGVLRFTNE